MGKRIIDFLLHYHAPSMLFIIAVAYVASSTLAGRILSSDPLSVGPDNEVLVIIMRIMVAVITGYVCLMIVLSRYYRDICERSLLSDRRTFKRSILELLRYFRDADPYRIQELSLPVLSWREAQGVILGKKGKRLVYRPTSEGGYDGANFALFALPGGGKTTSQIIPSAMRFEGSVLAIDIKGDIYNAVKEKRKIKLFCPDDPAKSCLFNPFYGLKEMSVTERKVLVEQIASILVPEDKNGKYFVEGGRDCFCGIALYMLNGNIETTFPDIVRGILMKDAVSWIKEIYNSDCSVAQEYTNSYYGTNETNVAGAYGEMRKRIRTLCSEELMSLLVPGDDSLSPTTLDEGYDIYIEIPQHKVDFYSPITTILVQRFMSSFMQRQDKSSGERLRPILFLLDEFPQLQFDFKTLSSALSTLRSKSVSIFMAQQSIAQLINRYGESAQREIIDTCQYISVMSVQDPQSRKFFQELLGERKTLQMTSGQAGDDTHNGKLTLNRGAVETTEPIFRQGDFANLGDDVLIYAKGKYIRAEKTYYFK